MVTLADSPQTVRDRLESDKRMVFRIDVVNVRETGAPHAAP